MAPGRHLSVAEAGGTIVGYGRAMLFLPAADAPADSAPRGYYLTGMFVRHGLVLAAIGVAFGLAGAAALTRLMSSLLFQVNAIDPATFAGVSAVLGAAAAAASYLPSRRASGVDPVEALRAE